MSARWSVAASPATCSGAIYVGVPREVPTLVNVPACPLMTLRAELKAFATPKSANVAEPEVNNTLSGLMSRCTMPRS
ncbi:MAG: hypothetical protein AMS21_06105 [Gemmatimonas sp. SG8_38_2]|nr:MAG: hypothetical protein AMS21_06105 [Gemmatimonas sp. SG8_38_2]